MPSAIIDAKGYGSRLAREVRLAGTTSRYYRSVSRNLTASPVDGVIRRW
jgi:hypothetical protein